MKNASVVLSALALAGVLILFGLFFSNKKNAAVSHGTPQANIPPGSLKLAYVNLDTFNTHYEYVKNKNSEFQKRQAQMEAELQRSAGQFQNEAREFQRKAQTGAISQSEGETTQKRLAQMQQSLQLREQSLSDQLLKEKESFNEELQKQLDEFLATYSKDKNFDFILSYSAGIPLILYANKNLDITEDVIRGMNERAKQQGSNSKKK